MLPAAERMPRALLTSPTRRSHDARARVPSDSHASWDRGSTGNDFPGGLAGKSSPYKHAGQSPPSHSAPAQSANRRAEESGFCGRATGHPPECCWAEPGGSGVREAWQMPTGSPGLSLPHPAAPCKKCPVPPRGSCSRDHIRCHRAAPWTARQPLEPGPRLTGVPILCCPQLMGSRAGESDAVCQGAAHACHFRARSTALQGEAPVLAACSCLQRGWRGRSESRRPTAGDPHHLPSAPSPSRYGSRAPAQSNNQFINSLQVTGLLPHNRAHYMDCIPSRREEISARTYDIYDGHY